MIITVGEHSYKVRDRATYAAKETQKRIFRRYYWKYAPTGYFLEDGSRPVDEQGRFTVELDDFDREQMLERVTSNPEYLNEVMDFHCIPVGGAPLLSHLLETYNPTKEEEAEIQNAERFFYGNGVESKTNEGESSDFTNAESPQETEATTQEST